MSSFAQAELLEGLNEAMGLNIAKPGLVVEVIRPLREAEFGMPAARRSDGMAQRAIRRIGPAHHSAARLLAQGRSQHDVSLITGYSAGHVSNLCVNEAFRELVNYYQTVEDAATADVNMQMQTVGLEALGVLRERLEDVPETFSIGQLQGTVEMLLVKPTVAAASASRGPAAGPGPSVNISFVSTATPGPRDVTDVEYREEKTP